MSLCNSLCLVLPDGKLQREGEVNVTHTLVIEYAVSTVFFILAKRRNDSIPRGVRVNTFFSVDFESAQFALLLIQAKLKRSILLFLHASMETCAV
jgi:hypothetical protein